MGNCLDVISFSRTFNDFTFKLSTDSLHEIRGVLPRYLQQQHQHGHNIDFSPGQTNLPVTRNQSTSTRTITLRFFTQVMSFPQKPEIRHQPGQSHRGFCSSHKFSSETRFRTPAIKRQRQAILDLHETSLQHWKSFNATLSDSNPSHAPQSRVSVKETDFVNGRNMLN